MSKVKNQNLWRNIAAKAERRNERINGPTKI